MTHQHSRQRRAAVAGVLLVAASGLTWAGVATVAQAKAPSCQISLQASDQRPVAGRQITLRWTSSGASELLASWTTAAMPPSGSTTTTKATPGVASYQVTGLHDGQYCGGAAVKVTYTAATGPAKSATPLPVPSSTAPSSSAPAPKPASTSATVTGTSKSAPSSRVAPTSSDPTSAVAYPSQSPTGGDGLPWYRQPADLLVLGLMSLLGSLGLWNRERLRALVSRGH